MSPDQPSRLDESRFDELVRQHRPLLLLHCYRLLGSVHEAEDAVQEALLLAWRGREAFQGRGSVRGWFVRIATNVCLRSLERRTRARRMLPEERGPAVAVGPLGEPAGAGAWVGPYPVSPLELVRDPHPGPEARYEAREAVRLAFIAAVQELPPRQRAVLLLRDVLGLSAVETATAIESSAAATNSVLQRARATIEAHRSSRRPLAPLVPDAEQRRVLEQYIEAWEGADVDGLVRLLTADATWSMPPWPQWYAGRADIEAFLAWALRHGPRNGRLLPTWANGQPAFGYYRRSAQHPQWRPFAIQVLELQDHKVRSITNFVDGGLFPTFGLPREPSSVSPADR
jgi:RNA polymerase sigma-70 factor (ECF subfamily)